MRFRTDPNLPGVEKLAISACLTEADCRPAFMIPAGKVSQSYGKGILGAQQAFMVKGWARSLACLTILLAAFESEDLNAAPELLTSLGHVREALPEPVRAIFSSNPP